MADDNQNSKIYFSGEKNPFDIIIEILEKNGIKETLKESMEKIRQGKISRTEALYKLADSLADQKITEKDFIAEIQKQLEITNEIAQNIYKDIKEKLLPLAQKFVSDQQNIAQKEKNGIINPPIPKGRSQTKPVSTPIITNETVKAKLKTTKNFSKLPKQIQEVKKIPRTGPDNYREPIE